MNTQRYITMILIAVLLLGGVYYVYTHKGMTDLSAIPGVPVKTEPTSSIYVDSTYNFTVEYPVAIHAEKSFTPFYLLSDAWRMNAAESSKGTAVVEFPVYKVDQGGVATGKAYPLFFESVLRVGVSKEAAKCYEKDAGYANQVVIDMTVNGIAFKRFSFADAGMMKYVQGESYRTVHNNICYVLEQIKVGSNYKDDTMTAGIPESTLDGYYEEAGDILKTFTFTK